MLFKPPIIKAVSKSDTRLKGANARWKLISIYMRNDLVNFFPILGQELYEWRWAASRAAIPGAIAAIFMAFLYYLLQPEQTLFYIALSTLVSFSAFIIAHGRVSLTRELEYRGHAIEWRAAVNYENEDSDEYLLKEARALEGYRRFKNISLEERLNGLRNYKEMADKWLSKHWSSIIEMDFPGVTKPNAK